MISAAGRAARRAADRLLALQDTEGYWCADLTADTTLESDYILLQLWMHPPLEGVWNPPTRALVEKAVESILIPATAGWGIQYLRRRVRPRSARR